MQTFGKTDSFLHEQKTKQLIYKTDSTKKPQYIKPKPHKRHAWNIKSGEKIKDRNRYTQFKRRYLSNLNLFITNDSLIISFAPLNACRTLFKDKKDGLALEFIPLNDYTIDSIYYSKPSRRNGACIFNGIVPKPLYKSDIDQLISKQRKERKSKNLVVNFGKIPDNLPNVPLEMNLLILKNNRIIDIIQFRYVLGGFLLYPIHADIIPYTFNIRDVDIKFKPDYDTLIYKVHFERDETTADYLCVRVFMDQINKKAYKPIYGILTSYASIEGPVDHNKVLYQQRANNLIDVIQEEIIDSFPLFVHTKENWDLFHKQVRNTKYEFLSDTSNEFVKKFLSLDQSLIDLDNQLKQQRYVNLYLISEEIITEEKQIKYALERYISTFNGINKISQKSPYYTIKKTDKKKLSDLQYFIFNKIIEGKIEMSALDTLLTMFKINKAKEQAKGFWQLEIDRLCFELAYNQSLTLRGKYNLLGKLAYINDSDPLISINYFIMTIDGRYRKQLGSIDYADDRFLSHLKKTLDKIENEDSISFMSDLRLFYHITKLYIEYLDNPMSDFADCKTSIKYIYNFFSDTTITEDLRFHAAKFLNIFRAYEYSFNILHDLYTEGTTNKEIIRNYLILLYSNSDYTVSENFQLLFDLAEVFTPEEWCKIFTDRARINFQILDYEIIRDFYCKQCGCE